MNSKKRFEGRQLLLVVAIFGILLMHVTSAAEVTGAYTTAAITEESPGEAAGETTTSGTQEAPGTASVDIITSVKQDATEVSAGETRTSAESSVTEGTVDIITSVKQDATEVSAGETRTSAESSVTEGTVGYKAITSAVAYEATTSKGVPSDTESGSSTQEQSQSNEAKGPTTETGVTGHTVKLVFTTRRVTSEETTASMGLAKETTAENVTSTREKTAVDTTTVAPSHENCKTCEILINGSSEVWKVNGSICESETDVSNSTDRANKVRLIFESHQRNSPEPSPCWTRNISFKLDCGPYAKRLEIVINNRVLAQYRRKRQQPDETTSASHTIVVNSDVGIQEMPDLLEKALNACITHNDCVEAPPQVTTVLTESSTAAGAVASRAASTIGSIAAGTESSSASGAVIVGDLNEKPPTKSGNPDIWEAHRGLFLTVLILISVCVIVTVVCCLCMAWRRRGREKHPDKQPISMEDAREAPTAVSNPIPDAEMIRDEAPMQERENPAVTPNGGGQHISKADEDNGWVVPLDELSKAEKEKPEVENTRL